MIISRVEGTPPGALGRPHDGVKVLAPGDRRRSARPRCSVPTASVTNLDEAVGELVNTTGAGQFAGYYNDEAATAERMRGGMYWSGDLAYRDADGFVYYAGRTGDWLRVDGENLAAAPIERILLRHPASAGPRSTPYPTSAPATSWSPRSCCTTTPPSTRGLREVPCRAGGSRSEAVAALRADLDALPQTATNKVLKRELVREGLDVDDPRVVPRRARDVVHQPAEGDSGFDRGRLPDVSPRTREQDPRQ